MELTKAIKERRSIRRFEDKPIPHEVLEEIVDLARWAPSWKNTQIARYIIVEDKAIKETLAEDPVTYNFTYNAKTILSAQALVILTYVENRSGFERDGSFSTPMGDRWQNFDCGIAAQTFCLACHEKGLGSVIMGYFDDAEIKKRIEIPEGQSVGAMIAIGYPAQEPEAPARKEVEQLLTII